MRESRRGRIGAVMLVIRGTQKLLRWLPPAKLVDEPSATRLGDWYGHLINVGGIRLVLLISEMSRLPVLLPGRDLSRIAIHLRTALNEVLLGLEIPASLVRLELAAMNEVLFAPTKNRSLLGTINDFTCLLEWELDQNPTPYLLDLSLKPSESPVKPLGYQNPADTTLKIFSLVN